MTYTVEVERAAAKTIAKIASPYRERILKAIKGLATEPRPNGSKKLVGRETWRIRVGDYRVIYVIDDGKLLVVVVKVDHRSKAYKG